MLQAVSSRNWALLACTVVLGTVWLVRTVLAPREPWLATDAVGVVLTWAAAVATLTATLRTGVPVTFGLLVGAIFTTGETASGIYSWGRKLTGAATVQAQRKPAVGQ